MLGRAVSHFEILEKLGEGGMGVVYKARDKRLGRFVALKILPADKVADAGRKQRFVQEAKAASAMSHPNIVHIYDIGEADGINFIAMEFIAGKTLDRVIPRHGMQPGEALRYAAQIADALAKAHAAGIVHRDLKPGNIIVSEQGVVKLLDFGLAKLIEPAPGGLDDATYTLRQPATEEGAVLGTVAYMSPEQAEGKPLDARSDIFSFGSLLYEMLTGRRAFQGNSKASVVAAILREEPKPPSEVVEGLSPELDRILKRCLRKDPAQRIRHMDDLKLALEELKTESDSGTLGAVVVSPRRRHRRSAWVLGVLVIVCTLAGALWFIRPGTNHPPEPALIAVPLMTSPGDHIGPSFSPDGNQVAFAWNGEHRDNFDIYIKLIGTAGPPLRLTTDPGRDYSPAWSPDGRYVAFLRDLPGGKTAVLLVPALGGPERRVSEVASHGAALISLPGPYASWSPDGNSLVVSDRGASLREAFGLFLVSIETGEKRRLTAPPATVVGDSGPAFSPDGRTLAFCRTVDTGRSDLYLIAFSDGLKTLGEPRQLTIWNRSSASPSWTADGHELIFVNPPGLWRVAVPSSTGRPAEPQRLASLGERAFGPAISRDGRRLAYGHMFLHGSIGRIMVAGAAGRSPRGAGGAQPLISSSRDDLEPQFSPNGQRIAFLSTRSGNPEIWVCSSDGTNAIQVTSFGGPFVTSPRWSPDGERLVFDSNATGEFDIYVTGANGGKPQRLTTHPANDGNPSWSHDGQWIYFDSARTGEQQVFRIPATGGEAIQVTHDGGFAPLESPDGRFLYYTKALGATSLWKFPLEGGQPNKVLDGLSTYISMAIVDSGVYFVPLENPAAIRFLSFATNQIRTVASLENPIDGPQPPGGLAISPDGRWILCGQIDQAGSELMLVENFR